MTGFLTKLRLSALSNDTIWKAHKDLVYRLDVFVATSNNSKVVSS